jgi:5-methylcytosine-specific restriction endonuclease McrA
MNKKKKDDLLKRRTLHEQRGMMRCIICGVMFVPVYGKHSWRETCSDACSEEQGKRRKRRKTSAYKARKKSKVIELFDPFDVFARDKWRCQLCGRKLKKQHRGTKRFDAPELDHIIPISKGGEHSRKNTQCACRKCNIEKGAKELGQLRLFG